MQKTRMSVQVLKSNYIPTKTEKHNFKYLSPNKFTLEPYSPFIEALREEAMDTFLTEGIIFI